MFRLNYLSFDYQVRIVAIAFALCLSSLWVEDILYAQKTSLPEVNKAVHQLGDDQKAAQDKAAKEHAAGIRSLRAGQMSAAESAAVAAQRNEDMLADVNEKLNAIEAAKAADDLEAKKSHDALMARLWEVGLAILAALLGLGAKITFDLIKIHGLVNSTLTTAKKGELSALLALSEFMHNPSAPSIKAVSDVDSRIMTLRLELGAS